MQPKRHQLHLSSSTLLVFSPSSKFLQDSRSFFFPFLFGGPKLVPVLHNIPQHGPPDEHQVFPARGVLDVKLELFQPVGITLEDVLEVPETPDR